MQTAPVRIAVSQGDADGRTVYFVLIGAGTDEADTMDSNRAIYHGPFTSKTAANSEASTAAVVFTRCGIMHSVTRFK